MRLRGWRAVAGLMLVLGLLVLPAQANAAKQLFKPGHYVGHTDQTCPPAPANRGVCQAGHKLPISFSVTGNWVSHIREVVVDHCQGEIKTYIYKAAYPRSWVLDTEQKPPFFFAGNDLIKHSATYIEDKVIGFVKGHRAYGRLESLLMIDEHGRLVPEGGKYCFVHNVRWHARLQRSPGSKQARRATLSSVSPSPTPLATASRSKLAFKPGHYVGHTNQTCTAKAAAWGDCKAGKRLPISFTVSGSFVSHVNAIAITKCSGGHQDYVHVLNYPKPSIIFTDPDRAFFFDLQSIIKQQMAATNDLVAGFLNGEKASGGLESFVILDSNGNLDPLGTTGCNSGRVRWQATLK